MKRVMFVMFAVLVTAVAAQRGTRDSPSLSRNPGSALVTHNWLGSADRQGTTYGLLHPHSSLPCPFLTEVRDMGSDQLSRSSVVVTGAFHTSRGGQHG